MGETEGLQPGPQVTEREGRDAADVVVLEGQIAERAWQIHGDRGEVVVGEVQGFQRPKEQSNHKFLLLETSVVQSVIF